MHARWTFLEVRFFDRQAALWVWHLKRGAPQVAWHKETAGWPGLEVAWATAKKPAATMNQSEEIGLMQHIATKRKRRRADTFNEAPTWRWPQQNSPATAPQQRHQEQPNKRERVQPVEQVTRFKKGQQFKAVPYFPHRSLLFAQFAQDPDDRSLWKGSWHRLFLASCSDSPSLSRFLICLQLWKTRVYRVPLIGFPPFQHQDARKRKSQSYLPSNRMAMHKSQVS